jgi:hypothetical protein
MTRACSASRPGRSHAATTSKRPTLCPGIIFREQGCGRVGVSGGLPRPVDGHGVASTMLGPREKSHAADDDEEGVCALCVGKCSTRPQITCPCSPHGTCCCCS